MGCLTDANLTYILPRASPKEAKRPYKVGNNIQISLNNRIMEAVIRAVIEETDGLRLQVDFGP